MQYDTIGRAFETDDPAVMVLIGPSTTGLPLEIGVSLRTMREPLLFMR
jgi:hypothetical protein